MNFRVVPRMPALALFAGLLFTLSAAASAATPGRIVLPDDATPEQYRIAIVPDVAARAFAGSVDIDLTVHRPTRRIVVNSADLVIGRVFIDDAVAARPRVHTDAALQTVTFTFARALATGAHTLHIRYAGRINDSAAGLFMLKYASQQGPRTALFTQFENSDARRFLPCWDEPGRKATFDLTADVPADEMALSNMPVATTEPLPGGRQRVHFQPTPRMSTYLLYFGSGDFERAHRLVDGVDVGVVVRRGELANAAFALDAASRILPWYDDYFGTPYPLPKLDMIAGPGASQFFGAMENWGAIFYFEQDMLIDPRMATEQDRQAAFSVIAHEMAHQWFGDLVTMAWWDDLWLNEGFASWMEAKVSDHFHPEWHVWLRAQEEGQQAMAMDARDGTHPVITPIVDVLQAAGAFDTITYSKGKMVIRELESTLGEEAFRAGVRRYMAAHAYGNTVTDDLWREMDRGASRPIIDIAHDLTRQAGVPMLDVLASHCVGDRTTVTLSQGHFVIDPASTLARTWRVPVALAAPGGPVAQAVVEGAATHDVGVDGCGPVVVNAGQDAYLRVRYDAADLHALTAAFATLSPADQLGVLNDARSLSFNAQLPMAELLALLRAVPADADLVVQGALVERLRDIDRLVDGLPMQSDWRVFARARLAPLQARVGWRGAPGESADMTLLRAAVLPALAAFGDVGVLAEARARFDRYLAEPASLDAETRRIVLRIVADRADAAAWAALHRLARDARTENERDEDYTLLASTRDAALAKQALELSLSGEPPATMTPAMVAAVAVLHPRLAVDFVVAHWSVLEPLIEPDSRAQFVPHLASGSSDAGIRAVLDRFAHAHIPAGARQELVKSEAQVRDQSRVRRERMPEVARWLAHPDG